MAIRTNKAIIETFEEMLDEMPFEKITVSSLAKDVRSLLIHSTITMRIFMIFSRSGLRLKGKSGLICMIGRSL